MTCVHGNYRQSIAMETYKDSTTHVALRTPSCMSSIGHICIAERESVSKARCSSSSSGASQSCRCGVLLQYACLFHCTAFPLLSTSPISLPSGGGEGGGGRRRRGGDVLFCGDRRAHMTGWRYAEMRPWQRSAAAEPSPLSPAVSAPQTALQQQQT